MQMDERKKKILEAIILDYIATADPVGSRTIAKKYSLGVSSATVRNEMADLEDMGYLEQPHTSAGRIPSETGYRYYVDCIMEKEPLQQEMKEDIQESLISRIKETEALIHLSSKLLSQVTRYTSLVLGPMHSNGILKSIQLIPVESSKAVLIIVLDSGHVEHRIMDVPETLKEEDYLALTLILNQQLKGLTVEQWRPTILQGIYHNLRTQKIILKTVMEIIEDSLTAESEQKLYLGGTLNILNQPEFKQIHKVKAIFELLEKDSIIKEVLAPEKNLGIQVRIGSENDLESMKECSLITATYEIDGKVIGTLGLLGPTRMEYSRAISIVEFLTKALTQGLNRI